MRKPYVALIGSTLLGCACTPPTLVVPSQKIPHQLAAECRTTILVQHPNGQVERQKVTVPAGWWIASPEITEGR